MWRFKSSDTSACAAFDGRRSDNGLNLERGSMYKDVVSRLLNIPEIVECHVTTGPYTMLIKLYARDNEQLMDLLNNKMQTIPGVVSTETLISLEQSIKREITVNTEE